MNDNGTRDSWTARQCLFLGLQSAIETADEHEGYGTTHPFQGSGSLEGEDDARLVLLLDDGSSYRLTAEQVLPLLACIAVTTAQERQQRRASGPFECGRVAEFRTWLERRSPTDRISTAT